MQRSLTLLILCLLLSAQASYGQRNQKGKEDPAPAPAEKSLLNSGTLDGLKFRSIGPALTAGRVADFAVNPDNPAEYYIAVASGGVWKTVNRGITFDPVFDGEGSYSIGCVTLDPNNSQVVWVGTGENNGQRSVAYGDGVYKSLDGGRSWKNMGLKASEHIGMIAVDPRNSQVVYVAAQGPLWSEGGDRGLYKTTDGGQTWDKVLDISVHTGVSEVLLDPRNPDVLYAVAWQRRRHVWTFISGGPESAIYKSEDAGKTWRKIHSGIPGGDLGRVGLAVSPVDPDVVYAIVEADSERGGIYRSANRGESWSKQSGFQTSGNYYQEIFCDPVDVDRIYIMDTYAQVSDDGGKTVKPLGEKSKHVDNHALWIDPKHPDYYLIGCDGGIYESYDRGSNWSFKANMPITQFYKVEVDNSLPFYYVYGGTQDNYSLGGPSRTINNSGIVNSDWFVTNGGDGFESQIDPTDPNIVYAQAQYGWLVRYDRKSGERVFIQPVEGKDDPALRWNWDAPLLISPHQHTRLYFAANILFRSDDRGNSWTAISPDLSRQLDRDSLPVMGRVWGMDAIAKNRSTSQYGNIVALSESPLQAGLLYVGTDDGLIQVQESPGAAWRKQDGVPGVPPLTYVNMLLASQHDASKVFAAFNNHKQGDFKPYLYVSKDKGRTWTSIAGDLPERGSVYCIAEDHVNPDLLFAGTEFGVYVTVDGGKKWLQLKGGLPTIAVRDMAIQKRENDLVLATFGRSFYVLDDYTPLRQVSEESLAAAATIFPVKDALLYVQANPLGNSGKSFQGESFYTANNPPVGATFTYYVKDPIKSLKQQRLDKEKELAEKNLPIPYPSPEAIRAEDEEEKPYLLFTIRNAQGDIVQRLKTNYGTGIQRITWDFRYPSPMPVSLSREGGFGSHLAAPGTYSVSMSKYEAGAFTDLTGPQSFVVKPLDNTSLPAPDREALLAFQRQVADLARTLEGANRLRQELQDKIAHMEAAVRLTPQAPLELTSQLKGFDTRLRAIDRTFNGDRSLSSREIGEAPSLDSRLSTVMWSSYSNTSAPTGTQRQQYEIVAAAFPPLLAELKQLVGEIRAVEEKLESYGAPYTPGRIPSWD
ncbi:MAG: hypothetical protein OHK0039_13400 [Bacteroidia bacterium]